jgi:hypothetical protein
MSSTEILNIISPSVDTSFWPYCDADACPRIQDQLILMGKY